MIKQEAVDYIENASWNSTRLGLERIRSLLEKLGNPQKKLRFVHVAGSNGKGSTCAMMESVLRTAGYRTGLFTSPGIQSFNERIRVCNEDISDEALCRITETVRSAADVMADHPSEFELITAIAMLWFLEEKCDIVVLEVGMGGALDSTNVIDAPEAAVLMPISLEHTEYLGDTVEAIAETKGGIIKPGTSCICWDDDPAVIGVIRKICLDKAVPLKTVSPDRIEIRSSDLEGQTFIFDQQSYDIRLIGQHQTGNAAMAVTVLKTLRERGWKIPDEAIHHGLASARWPARFEVLSRHPLFILDGGHNPQCAQALVNTLQSLLPNQKVVCLIGMLADKNYRQVIETIMPFVSDFVCLTPENERALSAQNLADLITAMGARAKACDSVESGIQTVRQIAGNRPILAFGSLYLAGPIRATMINSRC